LSDLFYQVVVTAGMVSHDLSSAISSLVLEEHHRLPATLSLELADPFKIYGHALREGMDVELDLGTIDDHSTMFVGRIGPLFLVLALSQGQVARPYEYPEEHVMIG